MINALSFGSKIYGFYKLYEYYINIKEKNKKEIRSNNIDENHKDYLEEK